MAFTKSQLIDAIAAKASVEKKTADRLNENLALFDFQLSDSEMKTLSGMNRNRRFNDPGDFCEAAFGRFFPIYE